MKDKNTEQTKQIEQVLERLLTLKIQDLRSVLYMVQMLEPQLEKRQLLEVLREKIKNCADQETFMSTWKNLLERIDK